MINENSERMNDWMVAPSESDENNGFKGRTMQTIMKFRRAIRRLVLLSRPRHRIEVQLEVTARIPNRVFSRPRIEYWPITEPLPR